MAKIIESVETIAQFIPIFLLFIVVTYFKEVARFSNTILGKIIAVCIIIFYTMIDKIIGALVCLLFIFYYQTDIVENMLNMDMDSNLVSIDLDNANIETDNIDDTDYVDDYVYFDKNEQKHNLIKSQKNGQKDVKKEGMISYVDLYGDDFNKDILINNEKKQDSFRKDNCVAGELMNKEVKVNYEMTEHVFPEVKFRRGFCNPCLKDCEFSIIQQKIETEDKLLRSKK